MVQVTERFFPYLNQYLYTGQLDNGLTVTVIPRRGFNEVMGFVSVNFGGLDNQFTVDGEVISHPFGLAHFLEHQVFENFGQVDFSQQFTALGAESNAFTGYTSTNYYFSTVGEIAQAVRLLQNLVNQSRFTELSMKKEKSIIKQEIDLYADDPDYRLYAGALASLYPNTALENDLAGSHESVDEITYDELKFAFDAFYRPSELHLLVVGDLNPEELFNSIEEYQADIKGDKAVNLTRSPLAYHPVVKKKSVKLDVVKPKLAVAFRPKEAVQKDLLRLKIVLQLYTNLLLGWTSTTYQTWYEQEKVDESFEIHLEVTNRFQFVMVTLDTDEPIALSARIKQLVKKASPNKDLSEEHFLTLKKELLGEFLMSLDSIEDLAVLYLDHQFSETSYFDIPEILSQLTLEEVTAVGKRFFSQGEAVDFTIFPK